MSRVQRKALRVFAFIERPSAWVLMIGGGVTFVAVVLDIIKTGNAKWATLLIAADLVVSGFSAVQQAEEDEEVPPPEPSCP